MQHLCPTCRRQFGEPGFCPFDGAPLVPGSMCDQETLVSAAMAVPIPASASDAGPDQQTLTDPRPAAAPAGPAPGQPTKVEIRKRTFPLTPSPASISSSVTRRG